MRNAAPALAVSDGQLASRAVQSKSQTVARRAVQQAGVLLVAAGLANSAIAVAVAVAPTTLREWRCWFEA